MFSAILNFSEAQSLSFEESAVILLASNQAMHHHHCLCHERGDCDLSSTRFKRPRLQVKLHKSRALDVDEDSSKYIATLAYAQLHVAWSVVP